MTVHVILDLACRCAPGQRGQGWKGITSSSSNGSSRPDAHHPCVLWVAVHLVAMLLHVMSFKGWVPSILQPLSSLCSKCGTLPPESCFFSLICSLGSFMGKSNFGNANRVIWMAPAGLPFQCAGLHTRPSQAYC